MANFSIFAVSRVSLLLLLLVFSSSLPVDARGRFLQNGEPVQKGLEWGMLPDSPTRDIIDLSGEWKYSLDGRRWDPVKIPSAYDFTGTVTFVRSFEVSPDLIDRSAFKLVVYGINYECRISINEIFIGKHVGGYTSFAFPIPENTLQIGKNNVIKIVVNNHLDARTTLPLRKQVWGWRNYGGVFRPLYILATQKVWIDDFHVRTTLGSNYRSATLSVTATIDNSLAESERRDTAGVSQLLSSRFRFWIGLYDKNTSALIARSQLEDVSVQKRKTARVESDLSFNNPKLWKPENPELYILKMHLMKEASVYDEVGLNIGIREIVIRGSDIYLNGAKIFLQGVLWREDHPAYGSAMTYKALEEDIVLLKTLGANLVRVGNHPPHPYVLGLCDRYGLLVMEEIPVWNVPAGILGREYYHELAKAYTREMVIRDRNHVSVLAWGIGDDFDSSEGAATEYARTLRTLIGSLDDRPVYYTTSLINNDVAAQEVDIAAINFFTPDVTTFKEKLEEWKKKHPSQPIIVARYGKVVEPGNYNGYSDPMSVESQARYLIQHFTAIKEAKISGGVIYSFADWRGDRPIMTLDNADRFLSTMGLVSYSREKRFTFENVRALYHNEKIAALALGTYSENAPITFVLVGFVLLLSVAYLLRSHRRFRESVIRSLLRPYNFFADIRDQRILSYFQSAVLGIAVAITMGLLSSSLFYYFRNSIAVDYILTHFLVFDAAKATFSGLMWSPLTSIFYLSLIFSLVFILMAAMVKLFSFFVPTKVYFFHAFSVAIWSTVPIMFLIPVGMIMYRVMQSEPYVIPLLLLLAGILLWVVARFLKSLSIIYDVRPLHVYAGGALVVIVLVGAALAYYDYTQSTFAYYKFFLNLMQGAS